MFGWFQRRRRSTNPLPARPVLLSLEQLEDRNCPAAPVIQSFTAVPLNDGHLIELAGSVTDENPEGVSITFGGIGWGSATADASGNFQHIIEVNDLGLVYATALDDEYLSSDTVQAELTSASPTVTVNVTSGPGRTVTLWGTVADEVPGNQTVTFTGVVADSVTTNSDGSFSLTAEASDLGSIQATTTDPWGLTSNTAEVWVTSQAPVITLALTRGPNFTITLSGTVTDEDPGDRPVTFAGGVSDSVQTAADGSFSLTTQAFTLGQIEASTTDVWEQQSNVAEVEITTQLSLALAYGSGRTVTLSGLVFDSEPGGQAVDFTGVVNSSVQTDADGWFSLTTEASDLGTIQASSTDAWSQLLTAQVSVASAAPAIASLSVSYGSGHNVTVSGSVTDEDPASCTVSFTGVVNGSVPVNADGTFSLTTEASGLGTFQAAATDTWGQISAVADSSVANDVPSISLTISYGSGRNVTISGTVTDETPGGLDVQISGVLAGSVTTNSDGTFSLSGEASGLGNVQAVTTDAWDQTSNTAEVTVASAAPSITSLSVSYDGGCTVTISGAIADEDPASTSVSFTGVVNGSVSVDANGAFSYTTVASGLGDFEAIATDVWSQTSSPAQSQLASAPPSVSMTITYDSQRTVTISGTVIDEQPSGLTVQFSGVVEGSVVTNSDGTFSFTAEASGLGTILATTQDVWDQLSDTAESTVASDAPVIYDFIAQELENGIWAFGGRVTDESAPGLVVQLGGLPSLQGVTATVDVNGYFAIEVQLGLAESGTATAQLTDWWGLESNLATTFVDPTPP